MRTVLAISPHLDDAAFSCGGTMAVMADAGWSVWLVTVFTQSIHPATGFALACQLDKGLSPDIDYMELRRAEDRTAAAHLGTAELRWLDLPEAPHRGYASAPDLFGPVRSEDAIWRAVAARLDPILHEAKPELLLTPQGLGNHVDHRQVIRAVAALAGPHRLAFYRDTPYAIRNKAAAPDGSLRGEKEGRVEIGRGLERKLAAACAYESQVGFQFGGAVEAAAALRSFAIEEGEGRPAERFLGSVPPV